MKVDKHSDQPHTLYRAYGRDDLLLYVGVTHEIEQRFKFHRSTSPWWTVCVAVTTEQWPDKASGLCAEAVAIKTESPLFNKVHNAPLTLPIAFREHGTLAVDIVGDALLAHYDGTGLSQVVAVKAVEAATGMNAGDAMRAVWDYMDAHKIPHPERRNAPRRPKAAA